jgi:hypothetical protein
MSQQIRLNDGRRLSVYTLGGVECWVVETQKGVASNYYAPELFTGSTSIIFVHYESNSTVKMAPDLYRNAHTTYNKTMGDKGYGILLITLDVTLDYMRYA